MPQGHPVIRSIPIQNPGGHRAVAAEVPLEWCERQVVCEDFILERLEIILALSAADDLAVSFRCEHVDAQRDLGPRAMLLNVKCLALGRIAMHQHWAELL